MEGDGWLGGNICKERVVVVAVREGCCGWGGWGGRDQDGLCCSSIGSLLDEPMAHDKGKSTKWWGTLIQLGGRRVVEGRCAAEHRMLSTLVGGDVVAGRERDRDDFPIEESNLMVGGQFPLPHNSPRIHVQDFFLHIGREIVYCNSTPIGFGA